MVIIGVDLPTGHNERPGQGRVRQLTGRIGRTIGTA